MIEQNGWNYLFPHNPPKAGVAKHLGYIDGEFIEEFMNKSRGVGKFFDEGFYGKLFEFNDP
jgi:hypothetical protein